MFDPTIGRWFQEDPRGFHAKDPDLYRYVGNSPTTRTDPSGLQAKQLGVALDETKTNTAYVKARLTDGKLGYHLVLKFTAEGKDLQARRYGLQALKSYLIVITADGKVTQPSSAEEKTGWTYRIDQQPLGNVVLTFSDRRRLLWDPVDDEGVTVIRPDGPLPLPQTAVFVLQYQEAVAGLSDPIKTPANPTGFTPITKGMKGKDEVLNNAVVSSVDYDTTLNAIKLKQTPTKSVYVYYKPGMVGCIKIDAQFVMNTLKGYKGAGGNAAKMVESRLGDAKVKLGDDPFEALWFPEVFDETLVGVPKPKK